MKSRFKALIFTFGTVMIYKTWLTMLYLNTNAWAEDQLTKLIVVFSLKINNYCFLHTDKEGLTNMDWRLSFYAIHCQLNQNFADVMITVVCFKWAVKMFKFVSLAASSKLSCTCTTYRYSDVKITTLVQGCCVCIPVSISGLSLTAWPI